MSILPGLLPPTTVLCGDVLEQLRTLPDESVQCCVTSPPYWGLRDYGVEGQLGLEPTPAEYVAKMVEVFREVRRVLRSDGTCWVNIGDSYCNTDKWGGGGNNHGKHVVDAEGDVPSWAVRRKREPIYGLKPKDLVGIPWRLAFALQDDGWWLRSDIIWHKPNTMPESVTDRPTKAHEYVFLLTKAARYFYDAEAVNEKSSGVSGGACFGKQSQDANGTGAQSRRYERPEYATRNLRSVWTIPTANYSGAHFATFPEALVQRCLAAGTSAWGCCPNCGAPWRRDVDATPTESTQKTWNGAEHQISKGLSRPGGFVGGSSKTTGWQPTCSCPPSEPVPCTALDPFAGSGTTLLVARRMNLASLGIELNPDYVSLIHKRLK